MGVCAMIFYSSCTGNTQHKALKNLHLKIVAMIEFCIPWVLAGARSNKTTNKAFNGVGIVGVGIMLVLVTFYLGGELEVD
jgi:hypothetical protein